MSNDIDFLKKENEELKKEVFEVKDSFLNLRMKHDRLEAKYNSVSVALDALLIGEITDYNGKVRRRNSGQQITDKQ